MAMVQKLCMPGGPSAKKLAAEIGIAHQNLSRWKKQFGSSMKLKADKTNLTPQEKLQIIIDTSNLDEKSYGEYLRKHGLHSHQIEEWKQSALGGFSPKPVGRPKKSPELVAAQSEIKDLKKDLRRKEKAPSEQTALLILKKKAQAIWGAEEKGE